VHRINTDCLHNAFALDTNATLDLATGTTPSGALKQDAALRPEKPVKTALK
jgi:hypothetical protein